MTAWRTIQRQNFVDWKKLFSFLDLQEGSEQVCKDANFPLNIPLRLAEKIQKNNLQDPILKQFLPTKEERVQTKGFCANPVQDERFQKETNLLCKYQKRALLICSSACAMHCRFCFRKNFPYEHENKLFERELKAIETDSSLSEIILSGGDPLSLSNEHLSNLINNLSSIPHIKKIRFHTRFPIGIPERIDAEFLEIMKNSRPQIVFIIHVNHPKEVDTDILVAIGKLQDLRIPILSQTVLLKGINDSETVLEELYNNLTNNGIVPYYLHKLDLIEGSAHFEVSDKRALELIAYLKKNLPGYAVPRYVQEIPGETSKRVLA